MTAVETTILTEKQVEEGLKLVGRHERARETLRDVHWAWGDWAVEVTAPSERHADSRLVSALEELARAGNLPGYKIPSAQTLRLYRAAAAMIPPEQRALFASIEAGRLYGLHVKGAHNSAELTEQLKNEFTGQITTQAIRERFGTRAKKSGAAQRAGRESQRRTRKTTTSTQTDPEQILKLVDQMRDEWTRALTFIRDEADGLTPEDRQNVLAAHKELRDHCDRNIAVLAGAEILAAP